jgi:hypothetical protein
MKEQYNGEPEAALRIAAQERLGAFSDTKDL